jgi:hypothetical protein
MGFGLGEIMIILILLAVFGVPLIAIYILVKYLGVKTCPYCAGRIPKAAKICRFCQRNVANV